MFKLSVSASAVGTVITMLVVAVVVVLVAGAQARRMTVAAIFDEGGEGQLEIAFKHAVEAVNRNRWIL